MLVVFLDFTGYVLRWDEGVRWALVAGTKNGAIASRLQDQIGTIEKGKLADLVILDADPLADIKNIRKVRSVMKEGVFVDTARLPEKRQLVILTVPPAL